jgi:serine phosphatase RsbU (regulator of sigma subunit)/pSer/pThr/pTyr-binding forkhead associated (FHA) protein
MAVLRILQGEHAGQLLTLEGAAVILGRHPACDIVLESASVSRQHARILNVEGQFFVEDLHSRNGTFLNDMPVTQRQMLKENDELGICDLSFVFHQERPEKDELPTIRLEDSAEKALMVDDDESPSDRSSLLSKMNLPSGSAGWRLEVNSEAKLKALVEIGRHLGQALGLVEVLPKLLDSLFAIFIQADRGFIVLKDPKTGRLVPKAVKHRRREDAQTVRISRTIVHNVMESKDALLSADAASDQRFDMSESIVDYHIRSMMCAPLVNQNGESMGVIQLDTLDPSNRFRKDDLDVLVSVAVQAAFAVENAQLHEAAMQDQALRRELAMAHEVQRGFLPLAAPRIPEYDFFEFYESANQLGGDYYDYIDLPHGRLAIVVADVSGKGISASLLMAKLSAEARYCLASEPTPAQAVARLNRALCLDVWDDRFVTMVLAILEPARHEVTILNAGHLPPLLRRESGVVEALGEAETGLPLGVDRDVEYSPLVISLMPGESLVLYTDGITEAMNVRDDLYGRQRLLTLLSSDVKHIKLLGRSILDDVKRFVGARPQSDDMCLTCFGRVRV